MTRFLCAVLLALSISTPLPAVAQSADEVRDRIEALHGDAEGFEAIFEILVEAMGDEDAVTVAELGDYPLVVHANGETYDILEPQDLAENFEALVMVETRAIVAEQAFEKLFVNSDGVMFGAGELWVTRVCADESCADAYWAILTINN